MNKDYPFQVNLSVILDIYLTTFLILPSFRRLWLHDQPVLNERTFSADHLLLSTIEAGKARCRDEKRAQNRRSILLAPIRLGRASFQRSSDRIDRRIRSFLHDLFQHHFEDTRNAIPPAHGVGRPVWVSESSGFIKWTHKKQILDVCKMLTMRFFKSFLSLDNSIVCMLMIY